MWGLSRVQSMQRLPRFGTAERDARGFTSVRVVLCLLICVWLGWCAFRRPLLRVLLASFSSLLLFGARSGDCDGAGVVFL